MPTRVELALLPPSCLHCNMLLGNMGLPFLEGQDFLFSLVFSMGHEALATGLARSAGSQENMARALRAGSGAGQHRHYWAVL